MKLSTVVVPFPGQGSGPRPQILVIPSLAT